MIEKGEAGVTEGYGEGGERQAGRDGKTETERVKQVTSKRQDGCAAQFIVCL